MNNRLPMVISLLLVAAMLGASLWAWTALPADIRIPIHWGFDGMPNGFAGKTAGLLFAPLLAAAISILFFVIPLVEPRRANLVSSSKFYRASWIGIVVLMTAVHGATVAAALHYRVNVGSVVLASVSLLFMVIGNYLGKSRSNFFAGVRTPWTLSSEYSWQRTHILAGRLFIAAGALGFATTLALPVRDASHVFFVAMAATVVLSVVASYVFWLRDPDRKSGNGAQ